MCAFNATLICDEDGLYDPCTINDRLLLGLKGTMISEAELHFIRARLQGGLLAKAARGELPVRLPVGLVYDTAGHVGLDPDAGVRRAVAHLFTTFQATGSASAVVKAFARDGLTYPGRHLTGPRAGELYWKPLRHDHVLSALHNPRYAGAYCYGRRRTVSDADGHQRTFVKPAAEWTTLIPGAHPGFITWEQFQANQAQLAANAPAHGQDRRAGPPREGPALLQGLLVCGKCGTRMTVNYHTRADGSLVPDYCCQREGIATGTPPCQDMCGSGVDAAVAEYVLAALSPMAIQAALSVSAELAERAADADRVRGSHVQRAQHAADAARRRYLAVDPTNRLVADALEADWNHRLRELTDAHDDYDKAHANGAAILTDTQAQQIRALAGDLPALWHDPATPMRERKRLIRLLVTDVTLLRTDEHIRADLRLPGGQLHQLTVPRPRTAWEQHTTPAATLAMIDELHGRTHLRRSRHHPQRPRTDRRMGQTVQRRVAARPLPRPQHPQPARPAENRRHAHPRRDRRQPRRSASHHQALAATRPDHRPPRRRPPRIPLPPRTALPTRQPTPRRDPGPLPKIVRRQCHHQPSTTITRPPGPRRPRRHILDRRCSVKHARWTGRGRGWRGSCPGSR